jgi:hypothetical protein
MQETKDSCYEHHERVVGQHTSNHDSDANSSDIEKRGQGLEHGAVAAPRDDDAVTLKTWAVVVVSYPHRRSNKKNI